MSVILLTGGGGGLCQGDPPRQRPPGQRPPTRQRPPDRGPQDRDPPGQKPILDRDPLDRDSPGHRPPGHRPPRQGPPRMVTSGRYASYWNAFLFCLKNLLTRKPLACCIVVQNHKKTANISYLSFKVSYKSHYNLIPVV